MGVGSCSVLQWRACCPHLPPLGRSGRLLSRLSLSKKKYPAHTRHAARDLECIGERVKPAAAAQGETDEEKLERVRKAVSDDIVNKGKRVELMGDFDAFETAVKAEAGVKEFPKKYRQKLRNNWKHLKRRRAREEQKKDGK